MAAIACIDIESDSYTLFYIEIKANRTPSWTIQIKQSFYIHNKKQIKFDLHILIIQLET
jgi:hypothetical protein